MIKITLLGHILKSAVSNQACFFHHRFVVFILFVNEQIHFFPRKKTFDKNKQIKTLVKDKTCRGQYLPSPKCNILPD